MAKYCCLFNHFHPGNGIYNYVYDLLDIFASPDYSLIIISNSPFDDPEIKAALEKKYNCRVFERENEGLDFGAWQWAMNQQLVPAETERLFLVNDSVFGPLFDLQPVIKRMCDDESVDFWGLSDSHEVEWHLQSYFMCFSRKAFSSDAFKEVFGQKFGRYDKRQIINRGEIQLSQSLLKAGFKGKAYISYDYFREKSGGKIHNPMHFFWKEMLHDFHFPFLKRELVVRNPEHFYNILDTFELVDSATEYPVEKLIEIFVADRQVNGLSKRNELKPLVICHMFFYDMALMFVDQLLPLRTFGSVFVFNISARLQASKAFRIILRRLFPGCIITCSPNQGRDIGGKFAALSIVLQLGIQSDITLIIHDKKSQHLESGQLWRDELFKIINASQLENVIDKFEAKKDIGIICSARFIQDEYNEVTGKFLCTSDKQIRYLLDKYNIVTDDHNYVAGNIFWIRSKLLSEFFKKRSLLQIRSELEKGNTLDFGNGTMIHSWERIMSWIATSQGYKLHGI